jgi:hypothetical protein
LRHLKFECETVQTRPSCSAAESRLTQVSTTVDCKYRRLAIIFCSNVCLSALVLLCFRLSTSNLLVPIYCLAPLSHYRTSNQVKQVKMIVSQIVLQICPANPAFLPCLTFPPSALRCTSFNGLFTCSFGALLRSRQCKTNKLPVKPIVIELRTGSQTHMQSLKQAFDAFCFALIRARVDSVKLALFASNRSNYRRQIDQTWKRHCQKKRSSCRPCGSHRCRTYQVVACNSVTPDLSF